MAVHAGDAEPSAQAATRAQGAERVKIGAVAQAVAAVTALCVSLASALFAWWQVDVTQTHNRRSLMPIIQVTPYLEGPSGRNGLYLTNDGLGPATLVDFQVKAGDLVVTGLDEDRWPQLLTAAKLNPNCFSTAWPRRNATIRPGVETPLLQLTKAAKSEVCFGEALKLAAGPGLQIQIDYDSIYSERVRLNTDSRIRSNTLEQAYRSIR
jgi:hypothetical protein